MEPKQKKERLWELDALRGFLILCVVVIHFLYFVSEFYIGKAITNPIYVTLKEYGSSFFILLSGICVTLGHHPVRRGLMLVPISVVITLATYVIFPDMAIVFGILHLLSLCMITYPIYERLPAWLLLPPALLLLYFGFFTELPTVETHLLVPLGFLYKGFASFDYFPLIPHFGYFLIGVFLGKTCYRKGRSLIPRPKPLSPVWRFLEWCGRYSLYIYLVHPPLFLGGIQLLLLLQK